MLKRNRQLDSHQRLKNYLRNSIKVLSPKWETGWTPWIRWPPPKRARCHISLRRLSGCLICLVWHLWRKSGLNSFNQPFQNLHWSCWSHFARSLWLGSKRSKSRHPLRTKLNNCSNFSGKACSSGLEPSLKIDRAAKWKKTWSRKLIQFFLVKTRR